MLDLKAIRNNPEQLREGMRRRHAEAPVEELLRLDQRWREKLAESERLKAERNEASEAIGRLRREGKGAPKADEQISHVMERVKLVSARIKELDQEVKELEERLQELLLQIPNLPHESVPDGESSEENVEVRRFGEPRAFEFEPKAHWELGGALDMIDFERAGA